MKKFAIAAALAASFLAAAPAVAQDVIVRIDYSDLDLATPAGADQLGQRIEANAADACGRPFIRDLKGVVAFEKCKDQVVADAIEQLGTKGVSLSKVG